jgi:hypothetical protein
MGFQMQDVLLEPYGAEILGLSVGSTTWLTACNAMGALVGFILAGRWMAQGQDMYRMAARGLLVGVVAFLMVIFAGYENFVSRIDVATESKDRPHWMGTIDFSGLKIKLIGSLVAISVIELLKDFIELSGDAEVGEGTVWRVLIHLTFVLSGVLFALMDWIADKREFHGTHK